MKFGFEEKLMAKLFPRSVKYYANQWFSNKMHEASNDRDFLGMMDHVLEYDKNIEDLNNEKEYLQTQIMALKEQNGIKRLNLSRNTSRYKIFRSARSHHGTTRSVSIGN